MQAREHGTVAGVAVERGTWADTGTPIWLLWLPVDRDRSLDVRATLAGRTREAWLAELVNAALAAGEAHHA